MRLLILGGGISGLVLARRARKLYPKASISLLEQSGRLGGVIETSPFPHFFEKGPRTLRVAHSPHFLSLVRELGLEDDLLFSSKQSARRFLWQGGKLVSLATLWPKLLYPLLQEPFVRAGVQEESVAQFAKRRFRSSTVSTLFDAMTLGIFGESGEHLSMTSCFPSLVETEKRYGSIVWPLLAKRGKGKGLCTLRSGLSSFIDALAASLEVEVHLHTEVEALLPEGVLAGGRVWRADRILSTLPGAVLGRLTHLWDDFPSTSLWVVSCAYRGVLPDGFGYLVPSSEGSPLLGAVFDSSIFPSQGAKARVSAMLRPLGDLAWAKKTALATLQSHLGLSSPLFVEGYLAKEAIPRPFVGYADRLKRFLLEMQQQFPTVEVFGNYVRGVSVEACIAQGENFC